MSTDLRTWLSPLILLVTATVVHAQTRLTEVYTSAGTDSVAVLDSASVERNFSRKFLDYFNDASKERKNKKLDSNIIGGPHYSSDIKLGLGLVAAGLYRTDRNDTILPPSNISLYGNVSAVGFYLLEIRGTHLFPRDKYRLDYNLYFCSFLSLYWGKGYGSGVNNVDESGHGCFQAQMKMDFIFRLARNFYVDLMAVFDYIYGYNIEEPGSWEGMNARTINFSLGLLLLCDLCDFLINAYKGYYLRADQRFSPAFSGNKYAFGSTELDTRYYHGMRKDGVLTGQFHTLPNYGNPLWGLMAILGSSYSMRGYYEGCYRDKRVMDVQTEFHQHVWERNGMVVQMGTGTVFPRFSEFDMKHILPNYGSGYRWEFKKRVNVCLGLGFGRHQTGFILNTNEVF